MQNIIITAKNLGLAFAAVLFVTLVVGSTASFAHAADASYTYYDTYTSSNNSSSGSYTYYDTYTPSSNSNSTNYTYYDTYTPSSKTKTTPTYTYYDTYTPSYTTPTYTTYTYTNPGCTSNCGGSHTTPKPTPTCTISVNKSSITRGEGVTVTWNSSNAQYGNISNVGTYLPTSGSYTIYPQNNVTLNGVFTGNGKTATCSANIVVTVPQPEPTCSITATPGNITSGQSVSIVWSSTNAHSGNITNVGNNLSANGSYVVYPTGNTTYTGTFYNSNTGKQVTCSTNVVVSVQQCPAGYTGSYPNCVPPVQNNLSCSISINNYGQGYNNGYWQPNSAITLSWNSNSASYGSINNGFGNVGPSGSRTVYPTQTTTYTGTFYNYQGQQVTCSATVYVNNYVPPVNPGTPYVTLSAVPYTGLELGPVGTVLYWAFLAFWCLLAAYLIVVKKVQNSVYTSLKTVLFGGTAAHSAASHSTHASYATPVVRVEDKTDDFILGQINRAR